jgi:predicted dehydrogenase
VAIAAISGLPSWFVQRTLAEAPAAAASVPKLNVALIGCGGRGKAIGKEAAKLGNVVAVSDVDAKRLEGAASAFAGAKAYSDFREALDRKDVQVVLNGTPDHWHTLINLAALRRGKDVYSEKPLTLTIDEGKRLVAAVRETKRIFQTGSQQRSDAKFRLACELVRNGRLGKLQHVNVYLPAGPKLGPFATAPVPAELNWDLWLGQAPKVEYVPERCHSSFRHWYDYSGGELTDWGAHHHDIALWGLGMDRSGPVSIDGKALDTPIPGGFPIPPQFRVEFEYANGVKQTTQSTLASKGNGAPSPGAPADQTPHGVRFEGEAGWIYVTRGKIEASEKRLLEEPLAESAMRLYVSPQHMQNFFDCVASRKPAICEAEIGHRAASVCHLANLSIRLGRKLKWDPVKEQFVGDEEANGYVARRQRLEYSYEKVI